MSIVYKNNSMQEIDLTSGLYMTMTGTDLVDYSWSYKTRSLVNPHIYDFYRNMVSKKLTVRVAADSKEEFDAAVNRLFEVFEKDVYDRKPGRLYLNDDYYMSCYVIGKSYDEWKPNRERQKVTLSLLAETGKWIKVEHNSFNMTISDLYTAGDGLDYEYDYPYDYANGSVNKMLYNHNFVPCDFEITIFGTCANPVISIGSLTYEVSANIAVGEYLKINTAEKKIYKVKVNGEKVNLFHYRSRERSNFFEKIPPGKHVVLWNGSYTFDVDLLYERSEPVWT